MRVVPVVSTGSPLAVSPEVTASFGLAFDIEPLTAMFPAPGPRPRPQRTERPRWHDGQRTQSLLGNDDTRSTIFSRRVLCPAAHPAGVQPDFDFA